MTPLKTYRLLKILLSPLIMLLLYYRLRVGREDKRRFRERLGKSSIARPNGTLIWLHGASVGEVNSLLPVLRCLRATRPDIHLLLTTGTRTGMRTLEKNIPAIPGKGAVISHYVPLDFRFAVARFFKHWHPTLSVFVESEFWPELLNAAPRPILLNGKISDRSWPRYQKWAWFFRPLLSRYTHILAQRDDDARRLRHLGATSITVGGNLKFDADPLPVNEPQLEKFRALIGDRPTVVFASTHPGEEEEAAKVHLTLKKTLPTLLTIIVPRHPHRGTAACNEVQRHTRNVHRRGTGESPRLGGHNHTDVYIADTLGELGMWYRLANVAVIGGSLVPHGGHNPLESLRLSVPTFSGPHMFNFQDMTPFLLEHNLLHICTDREDLAQRLAALLTDKVAADAERGKIVASLPQLSGSSRTAAATILEKLPLV